MTWYSRFEALRVIDGKSESSRVVKTMRDLKTAVGLGSARGGEERPGVDVVDGMLHLGA
jgi:hypothetical protein